MEKDNKVQNKKNDLKTFIIPVIIIIVLCSIILITKIFANKNEVNFTEEDNVNNINESMDSIEINNQTEYNANNRYDEVQDKIEVEYDEKSYIDKAN